MLYLEYNCTIQKSNIVDIRYDLQSGLYFDVDYVRLGD